MCSWDEGLHPEAQESRLLVGRRLREEMPSVRLVDKVELDSRHRCKVILKV